MPNNFLYSYQYLPFYINPDIKIGSFAVSWYSVMYLVAFVLVYLLLRHRIKKGESIGYQPEAKIWLINFLIYAFVGLIIGARLGYVLFYNLPFYIKNPLLVISPFDPVTHQFVGIYGMSYHGGLAGVIIAALIFSKKYKVNFWRLANFVVPAIPAGYFFGRIGNFINGELYGRITQKWWGMYFPNSVQTQNFASLQLRHPSQLYEAFLEGIMLFIILWPIRNKKWAQGNILAFYLIGYGLARFISEFWREPDQQIGYIMGYFTLGQIFSVAMIILAIFLFFQKKKNLV